jgi:hypothetical protein
MKKKLLKSKKNLKQDLIKLNSKENEAKRIIDIFINSKLWRIIRTILILINNLIFTSYVRIKLSDFVFSDYIRKSEKEYLLNEKFLTTLISRIGFHNAPLFTGDLSIVSKYLKTGLLMLQYPKQFSKYLLTLSKFNIQTYLEIGTSFGGSFITTVEYLMKFNPNFKYAVGVDLNHYNSMQIYAKLNKKIKYLVMDSQSSAFKKYIAKSSNFDLILIDGNHSFKNCKSDFETVKGKAKMIAFHDILENEIKYVWEYIKDFYINEYFFVEFTDQYLKEGKYLGIGLIIRKDNM